MFTIWGSSQILHSCWMSRWLQWTGMPTPSLGRCASCDPFWGQKILATVACALITPRPVYCKAFHMWLPLKTCGNFKCCKMPQPLYWLGPVEHSISLLLFYERYTMLSARCWLWPTKASTKQRPGYQKDHHVTLSPHDNSGVPLRDLITGWSQIGGTQWKDFPTL